MSAAPVLQQLEKVLASAPFEGASRSRALLKFVVEQTVANQADQLKEYTLGAEALGKGATFDPRTDPIVRAEVSRLRTRLDRYYSAEGLADPIQIVLAKGSYVPQFVERAAPKTVSTPSALVPQVSLWRRVLWAAGAVLAAASIFTLGRFFPERAPKARQAPVAQFDVVLSGRGEISGWVSPAVALTRDGSRLIFASIDADGATRLNRRRLDNAETAELPGTEGARVPFLSPDGRWVGFWASGKLKKTPVDGGSPVVLGDLSDINGASWGDDDTIIAAVGTTLVRIPASGGPGTVILDLAKESTRPEWPQVLPGANGILFTTIGFAGPNHAAIEVLSPAAGKRSILARGGSFGRYLPDSFLTYVNQGTLFAVPLDMSAMKTSGDPVPILEGVRYSAVFGYADLDISRTGLLVYRKSNGTAILTLAGENGETTRILTKPGNYFWPRLSGDGKRLALSATEGGDTGLWIYEGWPDRLTRLPVVAGQNTPLWTANGKYLILGGARGGLSWVSASGSRNPQVLTQSSGIQVPWSLTADGSRLAYHELNASTGFDLWTIPIHESADGLTAGTPEPFLRTPAFETYPTFSPDGHWIAYGSNESGTWEVYVRAFPYNGTKVQISKSGGRIPHWSGRRRELLFRTDDQRIMAARYSIRGETFVVDSVRLWSPVRLADTGVLSNFDFGPDGRLVALMPAGSGDWRQSENDVTFILNFRDQVRRRVGLPEQ